MYRALYRTWRPQTFDDVCGQEHITDILKYQVSEGRTSHAYLFCGSRGTGKTTCAKILAKAVNCLHPKNGNPCNECEACRSIDAGAATDVIEMDAASNNGVDNVRDLKEEIVFLPAELKYRVYIIDEVHMMSPSAFNALLKTLEEPPSYVLFILATTELSKLPSTIVSRCQRCDFRRIATDVIVARLSKIAAAEGMTLHPDGARMIARSAQGGMRDAVSLLELCGGANAPIDEALVTQLLGAGDRGTLCRVVEAIAEKDYGTLYRTVDDIVMSSGDLAGFWGGLGDLFRDLMVFKTTPEAKEYLDLTDSECERLGALAARFSLGRLFYMSHLVTETLPALQKTGISRRSSVEVALTRMCDPRLSSAPEAMVARLEELEKQLKLIQMGATPIQPGTAQPPEATMTVKETPEAPSPAVPEAPAAQEEGDLPIPDMKGFVEEFRSVFALYGQLLSGSEAFVGADGVLRLYLRPHILLKNLREDARAVKALMTMGREATGREVVRLELITTAPPKRTQNEETFF